MSRWSAPMLVGSALTALVALALTSSRAHDRPRTPCWSQYLGTRQTTGSGLIYDAYLHTCLLDAEESRECTCGEPRPRCWPVVDKAGRHVAGLDGSLAFGSAAMVKALKALPGVQADWRAVGVEVTCP